MFIKRIVGVQCYVNIRFVSFSLAPVWLKMAAPQTRFVTELLSETVEICNIIVKIHS